MLHIITDSTVDMPSDWKEKYNIHILPMSIVFGSKTYLDGVDISSKNFYDIVKQTGIIPITECPSPGQWSDLIRKIARKGDDVLTLHLSSKLSGSFNSAKIAAQELKDEFNVIPFDSLSGSTSIGYMCREARELDRLDAKFDTILKRLDFIRKNLLICFTLGSLDFARVSGRYNALKNALVSIVKINPTVYLQADGSLKVEGISRTLKNGTNRMADSLRERFGGRMLNIGIMYARDPEPAINFWENIKNTINFKEWIMTDIGITIASHIGPGSVGLMVYPIE
ncbi:MAG TPA: DegV family protein [Anaerolineaceae bacterium]|nr:DegV family protein [Anaerolineaceae bacterium]